jgi:hypothetical protein
MAGNAAQRAASAAFPLPDVIQRIHAEHVRMPRLTLTCRRPLASGD